MEQHLIKFKSFMFVPFAGLSAKQISKVTDEERRVANKQARERAEIEACLK